VPRNAEVIRQWTILREIERARAGGVTIDELATSTGVTTRTIRRDLQALEESGFPLFDDRSHDDGRTRWCINGQAFKGLAAGLTLSELCALYFSRTLLESLSDMAFRDEVEQAFDKLASALTPHMRAFLDQLPRVIASKPDPLRRKAADGADRRPALVRRILDATLHLQQTTITYHSASSERIKSYTLHPYRLAYAQGGLYLLAFVPEYGEIRTFAMERVLDATVLQDRFTPIEELPEEAFPHSLGVHSGQPERVEIDFQPDVAEYVRARQWHQSQQLQETGGGGLSMTLHVTLDRALRSWILSFGPFARVRTPEALAQEIAAELGEALAQYGYAPRHAGAVGTP
jgi:predicted DNA-binding transcriptional regulator YafY